MLLAAGQPCNPAHCPNAQRFLVAKQHTTIDINRLVSSHLTRSRRAVLAKSGTGDGPDGSAGGSPTTASFHRRVALLGSAAPCLCGLCGRRSAKATSSAPGDRNELYDRYFATAMRYGMDDYEAAIRPVKAQLFTELVGDLLVPQRIGAAGDGMGARSQAPADGPGGVKRVLEVGIGTGPNFPFYTAALAQAAAAAGPAQGETEGRQALPRLHIAGLDPNPEMLKLAAESARAAGMQVVGRSVGTLGAGGETGEDPAAVTVATAGGSGTVEVYLKQGSADALPYDDDEFDAAVVTLVLCSVPSPAAALAELRRVVRPTGHLLLIEHVAAGADRPGLRLAQSLLTPLQRLLADGCSLNRDTGAAVRAAGWGGPLREFELEGFSLLAPHVAGVLLR